ncbi:MAG: hypothetical protein ABI460_05665 [Caldimonas sp.]
MNSEATAPVAIVRALDNASALLLARIVAVIPFLVAGAMKLLDWSAVEAAWS